MSSSTLHLHELVICRWVEDVTQQLDSLQHQSSASAAETASKDMFVVFYFKITVVFSLIQFSISIYNAQIVSRKG